MEFFFWPILCWALNNISSIWHPLCKKWPALSFTFEYSIRDTELVGLPVHEWCMYSVILLLQTHWVCSFYGPNSLEQKNYWPNMHMLFYSPGILIWTHHEGTMNIRVVEDRIGTCNFFCLLMDSSFGRRKKIFYCQQEEILGMRIVGMLCLHVKYTTLYHTLHRVVFVPAFLLSLTQEVLLV